jgi:hypothetical protein
MSKLRSKKLTNRPRADEKSEAKAVVVVNRYPWTGCLRNVVVRMDISCLKYAPF